MSTVRRSLVSTLERVFDRDCRWAYSSTGIDTPRKEMSVRIPSRTEEPVIRWCSGRLSCYPDPRASSSVRTARRWGSPGLPAEGYPLPAQAAGVRAI